VSQWSPAAIGAAAPLRVCDMPDLIGGTTCGRWLCYARGGGG